MMYSNHNKIPICVLAALFLMQLSVIDSMAQGFEGYYRFPDVHKDQIVFVAEGDLWTVSLKGGLARRITTHAEEELYPAISPDGKTIAYTANYEGPAEIYTIPFNGGIPTRWTYERDNSQANGWTPDGKILYDTRAYSTLPDRQLVTIDLQSGEKKRIPLSQASEGSFDENGKTVFFVRPAFHRNVTKRYKGGTARQIWKYTDGEDEAIKLTNDFSGGSHHPLYHDGRVYFITDRDGTMNIWSMDVNGKDLKQHTEHKGFDIRYAKIWEGSIVYQLGADIWHYEVDSDVSSKVQITLQSDLDQMREKWVENPMNYVTSAYPDPTGKQIVLTARGRVFVAPVKTGRFVEFTEPGDVRYRDAVFSEDGKKVIALSDESGEFEFVEMPANGKGKSKQLTTNGKILRYKAAPSPDGKWITYSDLENNLYLFSRSDGKHRKISRNNEGIRDYTWSPDSKWIAYCERALNQMFQIFIYDVENDKSIAITTDRANSTSPAWGSEGNFVYFLSDRNFQSLVGSPWGTRQPEPYFDASEKIYHISLKKGIRSPFRPADELMKPQSSQSSNQEIAITIDFDGIKERIEAVPVKPGNYNSLSVNKKAIYLISSETGVEAKSHLSLVKIGNEQPKIKTMIENVRSYFMTSDKSKLLVRKGRQMYMLNAGTSKVSDLSGSSIDLSGWKFSITPREDWEQLFTDAWRMERDYFYDKNMHGVDWKAMYEKYLPLLDRVTTRLELSDLIGRFVGELSALHTSVRGGDARADDNDISVASLGARFSKDKSTGGFKIEYIYKSDPDYPDLRSPLDDPFLGIRENDIITHVDGKSTTGAIDIGEMIRNKAERQVLLTLKRGKDTFEKIVTPIGNIYRLKYRDWEYSRRLQVEKAADNKIGYVHLQAMTSRDISQWYKEFYPVFDRPGLIIDVRHNNGGNIDSFILEKLLRKAWMYWKGRSGIPYSNMPYAFRGHIVILVDQNTSSDGEAFADGFKRLKLGTAIGMRTWGGEIWLSSANRLSDGGLARAPMFGVYDEEGNWLIEGHGFEPDIEVDNLPHATFNGKDAQLEKAIEYLQNEIKKDPRKLPEVPPYPDKSFDNK